MKGRQAISAGLLLFRRVTDGIEVFLAHPGGPFWRGREEASWTIPKGIVEPGEDPQAAAIREFQEETGIAPEGPYIELGSIRQKGGKTVHAWAWEGDADPTTIRSNLARTEWPRGSGRWVTYPEVDRCAWFRPPEARVVLNAAQVGLLERLLEILEPTSSSSNA
jgi:predicted NUDIX family NTP pyrophosphohydrolase